MINYVIGDATEPIKKPAIIMHICNDIGRWGSGFVVPLGIKYPRAKDAYLTREWYALGQVDFVECEYKEDFYTSREYPYIIVANIIGQHGVTTFKDSHPIRYEAVNKGINRVVEEAKLYNASVHAPRLGCGLAGGTWSEIKKILNQFPETEFYIYDLPRR